MKKTKSIASLALVGASLVAGLAGLTSCGDKTIRVWVGEESAEFYQTVCDEYLAANPDSAYNIEVKGVDTGSVAGTITQDPEAAGDIYTVAHDNIGKLAAAQCAKPITDTELTEQILNDNPESFQNVIYSKLNGTDYLYAAPYISQALFLYYDKHFVSEEQASSFETLFEAAKNQGTKAFTVTGDDGYNNSFTILARKVSDKSTSVKIYEGADPSTTGTRGECNFQGDDTIASLRWYQDALANENGFKWASADGWNLDFKNHGVLAVIGGAWHYEAAAAAVGESYLGMTLIPTYTFTESQVAGLTDVAAGDTYRGGTFADCKCFMINSKSKSAKYEMEQDLIKYLTSKDIQDRSFKECSNVPAYSGASEKIAEFYEAGEITANQYNLAKSQVEMADWGIPQPFINGTLNTAYYSKEAPSVYKAMIEKKAYPESGDVIVTETETLNGIRQGLYLMEYIWMKSKNPKNGIPATLPSHEY